MSQPRRHDAYGRPRPHLAEPSPPDRLEADYNRLMRQYLLALLEDEYRDLFQQGVYADITIGLRLVDGILRRECHVTVVRHHQFEGRER